MYLETESVASIQTRDRDLTCKDGRKVLGSITVSLPMHSAPTALLSSACDAAKSLSHICLVYGDISDRAWPDDWRISLMACKDRYCELPALLAVLIMTGKYVLMFPAPALPSAVAAARDKD